MIIEIEDEDLISAVIDDKFVGKYKKYKSNKDLQRSLSKIINIIRAVKDYDELKLYSSLNCEALKGDKQGFYSLRLGFKAKERLIFTIKDNKIIIVLIEISEHYGDH